MGLITQYSSANRVISSDKVVTYSKRRIYGSWTYLESINVETTLYSVWEYHRYCSKSYSYVGMTKAAAQACAQAMVAKYTRSIEVSIWNHDGASAGSFTDSSGGEVCMADIAIQHKEGCMYDVIVNVREDDSRLKTYSTSVESLFSTENARDYDED